MALFLADESMKIISMANYINSVIWNVNYCGAGDFELVMPFEYGLFQMIKKDCFWIRPDSDAVMITEKMEIQEDMETGASLLISGRSAESLLSRRIVWDQTNIKGSATDAVLQLMRENVTNPTATKRKIELIRLGEAAEIKDTVEKQITGEPLGDTIEEMLKQHGAGYRLRKIKEGESYYLAFEVVKGSDRSIGNAEGNTPVLFCENYDNLKNSDYTMDYTEYKNVCLVAGEGEGVNKQRKEVGEAAGLERREMYYEAGSLSTNGGSISNADYQKLMAEAGKDQLTEVKPAETFTGEIVEQGPFRYGIHYFLGDIVTLKNKYGITANVRITGRTENKDENGYNTVLSFEKV